MKFYYDVVMNPYVAEMRAVAMRSYFEDMVSVRVENDLKLIVRWRAHTVRNEQGEEEKKCFILLSRIHWHSNRYLVSCISISQWREDRSRRF